MFSETFPKFEHCQKPVETLLFMLRTTRINVFKTSNRRVTIKYALIPQQPK